MIASLVADTGGCYMETEDGRTVDLGNLCNPPQTTNIPSPSRQFAPNDQVVSDPSMSLPDPEFDRVGSLVTWQDGSNQLWVASVDPVTGAFIPPSGQGQLLDTGLVSIAITKNGPEWIYGQGNSQIFYTKYINDQISLSRAWWTGSTWRVRGLQNGADRVATVGSLDPGDVNPRIIYKTLQEGDDPLLTWRELNKPVSETFVPNATVPPNARWVEGDRSIGLTIDVGGERQCAKYDIDTGTTTQLTFNPGNKGPIFMWKAPEFNNELVFFCLSDGLTSMPIYRKIDDNWTIIHTIVPPSTGPYINSPEPFVYNGKSYVSFLTRANRGKGGSSDVWIAGIDATTPLYRKVSASTEMNRTDPESFVTPNRAFIYYTEVTSSGVRIIHRCATGLNVLP
ncbi:MAG: hypothetical protein F6K28_14455 [Microcoleus sp. SIO2G3]|nr:hypothetical protein [Microcoleus sp. SIO2G3]